VVCSYCGKLLGLMAIHLILLSVNWVAPTLTGSAHIYSDCLGALDKIRYLPPHRISSKCRHSDVLKNVMLHCGLLTFTHLFSHVSAHQDNRTKWENLTRKEQLNCVANFGAKRVLLPHDTANLPRQDKFLLEAVCIWAGREKMTSDTGHYIRFHAHQQLAREEFAAAGILTKVRFDFMDWHVVHSTLSGVPRMFQVWACNQVFSIAPTNYELSRWSTQCPLCPSCMQVRETCAHILHWTHAGRVDALLATIKLDQWMKKRETDPDLQECIYEYATGRGGITPISTDGKSSGRHWMEKIHGGDGMQGDLCDPDHLQSTERISNERKEMDGGTDHITFRGHTRAMAVPKHTGP
jgi:hypothetical protein